MIIQVTVFQKFIRTIQQLPTLHPLRQPLLEIQFLMELLLFYGQNQQVMIILRKMLFPAMFIFVLLQIQLFHRKQITAMDIGVWLNQVMRD